MTPGEFVTASRFAQEALRRWRLDADWLESDAPADDPSLAIESRLRRLRQLEALRIQWRETQGEHDIERTGALLSALAGDCLEQALQAAEESVAIRHGRLRDADGAPARLAVLALGKLGGDELNFNSDLDLVFCHDARGQSDGARALPAREWFGRVVRELTRLIEEITPEGRAWVIDTRLRPFGQAGALVWSLEAMEQYFINEGRTWERYAWLKARPVAGDLDLGGRLIDSIRPFVFRRYLDYGLFESLRALHADIDRRSRREDLSDDIKRGPGGIRELEFLVQSLQLLRGGREPSLRVAGFLPALRAARRARLLPRDEARTIDSGYRFLRAVENRLQLVTGRQTHELTDDAALRDRIAGLMDLHDGDRFSRRLARVRDRVRTLFTRRFEAPAARGADRCDLWPPDESIEQRLRECCFEKPEAAGEALARLARRLGRRPLSAEARRRLDRLMPELLDEVTKLDPPDCGFDDLLALIETIAQRSAYLALLHERPQTLERCVRVFRASARVAGWIVASPQLLDDLLAPDASPELPPLPTLPGDDVEASLHALARYRQAGFVRTALGQLDGSLDRAGARLRLTGLAEVILGQMARMFLPEDGMHPAIIGYGNLGAGELHYTSDLDLVFLHDREQAPVRAVQRLINAMQLPLPGGRLYEIDTRLRPNGNAGMLVSTLDSFADYQSRHAWIWEHQALIRARCVSGDEPTRDRFDAIRAQVLRSRRDPDEVREALANMRQRQIEQRGESREKALLGDVQFIAELGVLLQAVDAPALVEARATVEQLRRLGRSGWIDQANAGRLIARFEQAAQLRDRRFLERECAVTLPGAAREEVDRIGKEVFAGRWWR